jgi:uncharacterized protein with von Willebrand factor type A (vWA) domain
MNKQPARRGQELLAQMGQIPVIVQGKLSERRAGDKITGHKLQCWRHGQNQTRHVAAPLVDTVRKGTEGYDQFMKLAQQYVEVREAEAFSSPTDSKKKPTKP